MFELISGLFGLIGSGVKGLFGFKEAQAATVQTALKTLSDVNTSNSDREKAIASIISSEATSGYWLAAVWRPLVSVCLFGMILASFFGFVPPHLNDQMTPMMSRIFDLFQICLCGYIPARTVEKIISNINLSGVLKELVKKGVS